MSFSVFRAGCWLFECLVSEVWGSRRGCHHIGVDCLTATTLVLHPNAQMACSLTRHTTACEGRLCLLQPPSPIALLHCEHHPALHVTLPKVLACDATLGYEDIYNVQLLRFNATPVKNLAHLAALVLGCTEQYCRFDLEYNEVVIVETSKVQGATQDVMLSHGVPFAMSADLRSKALGH